MHTVTNLDLDREDGGYRASLCLNQMSFEELLDEQLHRPFLHPEELAYYEKLPHSPRRDSYLMGRYCVKHALKQYLPDVSMQAMLIRNGILHHPCWRSPRTDPLQAINFIQI